ncbi:MAG: hypothetical protein ACR2LF_10680 [Jatrophihabitantaceae bacterium]
MGSIGEAAGRLAEHASAAAAPGSGAQALHRMLLAEVHDPVLRATAGAEAVPDRELGELGAALRACVPAGAEDRLDPRVRVLVRLLRRDAVAAAWALAQENASGVVEQRSAQSTLSGAARTSVRLPLLTLVEGNRVYAWLPGFRDPHWPVPDEVYDLTADVAARCGLDLARLRGEHVQLGGWAHLTVLAARADDAVSVALDGPGGARFDVPAQRVRRPDLVRGTGEALTRLAWAGWQAQVPIAPMLATPGTWRVGVTVGHGEVVRTAQLGPRRGPLAAARLIATPHELRGRVARLSTGSQGALTVLVQPLGARARVVPRPVRRAARALIARRR